MKKIISAILSLLLLYSSFTAFATDLSSIIANEHTMQILGVEQGQCGKNLKWKQGVTLHPTFEITGTGDMYNYDVESQPYPTNAYVVKLDDNITFIGNYAFYNFTNITEINIPNKVTEIGYDAFKNCSSLLSVEIPESVTIIGSSAFEGCTNLQSVTLPNNLQNIYYWTFCMCKNLKELKINDGVKEIWMGAFFNCSNLETIYIPKTVENIGNRVFYGCDSLKTIYYSGNKTDWKNISIGSGNSEIDNAEIIFLEEDDVLDNKICTLCGAEMSNDNIFYDEDNNLICQDCYNELSESEQECYICGEYFNPDDMLYDEDDNLICQNCYEELQSDDYNKKINEIECPHCGETFEESEDVYDQDGDIFCPYCDEYIFDIEKSTDDTEIELITSDWAEDEVYEAYQNGLIPNEMLKTALYKNISREEFAAVAVKLYEKIIGYLPDVDIYDTPFEDCNYASEYNNYIAIAYDLGITNGTSSTTFSPYENITREQLAVMLSRVLTPPDNRSVTLFADHNNISQYAVDAVYFMTMHDIIKGVGDNRFAPKETATREQALLITSRLLNASLTW